MSIIYDALKKVGKSIHNGPGTIADKKEKSFKFKYKIYIFYLLVICLGIFMANIFFGLLSQPKTASISKIQKPETPLEKRLPPPIEESPLESQAIVLTVPEKKSREPLVLNGIFFSQDEGYALIDNQIVKKGDVIKGATVKEITSSEVELEFEGSTIKLTTSK